MHIGHYKRIIVGKIFERIIADSLKHSSIIKKSHCNVSCVLSRLMYCNSNRHQFINIILIQVKNRLDCIPQK